MGKDADAMFGVYTNILTIQGQVLALLSLISNITKLNMKRFVCLCVFPFYLT